MEKNSSYQSKDSKFLNAFVKKNKKIAEPFLEECHSTMIIFFKY